MIDTLEISKKLLAAGFADQQAEALAHLLRKRQEADLSLVATRADLAVLKAELRSELGKLGNHLLV